MVAFLAAGDGDDARKIAFAEAPQHLRIRFGRNQNVAVSQEKRRVADEILCQFRCLARAVLHGLPAERDARAEFFAVAEMAFNDLGRQPVTMKISRTPAATMPATMCSRIGLPCTRSMGLGNSLVSSRMRVPLPAARMTAFTGRI